MAALAFVLCVATPAHAENDVALEITGTQATGGKVTFFLAARGIPASELTAESVSVTVGGSILPARVEQFAASSPGTATKPRAVMLEPAS